MTDHGQARNTDPWTAKDAAMLVRPGGQRRRLLEAHLWNPGGLTDEEAAAHAGVDGRSEYATRCSELVRAGLLENTDESRPGEAGMARIVRRITDKGAWVMGNTSDAPPGPCSCGDGLVGHTTSHESTDRPGIVRIVREGKTDQYMNVARAAASAADSTRVQNEKLERERQRRTPRIDPSTHRLMFGGPFLCRGCDGTGGNLLEACFRCGGTGLTR